MVRCLAKRDAIRHLPSIPVVDLSCSAWPSAIQESPHSGLSSLQHLPSHYSHWAAGEKALNHVDHPWSSNICRYGHVQNCLDKSIPISSIMLNPRICHFRQWRSSSTAFCCLVSVGLQLYGAIYPSVPALRITSCHFFLSQSTFQLHNPLLLQHLRQWFDPPWKPCVSSDENQASQDWKVLLKGSKQSAELVRICCLIFGDIPNFPELRKMFHFGEDPQAQPFRRTKPLWKTWPVIWGFP